MFPWLKRLFTDETAFVGYFRAIAFGVGGAISSGMLDATMFESIPKPLGIALLMLGGLARSSSQKDHARENGGA